MTRFMSSSSAIACFHEIVNRLWEIHFHPNLDLGSSKSLSPRLLRTGFSFVIRTSLRIQNTSPESFLPCSDFLCDADNRMVLDSCLSIRKENNVRYVIKVFKYTIFGISFGNTKWGHIWSDIPFLYVFNIYCIQWDQNFKFLIKSDHIVKLPIFHLDNQWNHKWTNYWALSNLFNMNRNHAAWMTFSIEASKIWHLRFWNELQYLSSCFWSPINLWTFQSTPVLYNTILIGKEASVDRTSNITSFSPLIDTFQW